MKYNTIVIGGGLAGLTAGATLSKFGKKVLLLEQHHKPGGCAFLLVLYLGFKTDVERFGVKHYSNFIQGDDVKTLKDVHPNQLGDWSKRSFIFVDYGKIDAQLAPRDKSVGAICGVDYLQNWEGLSKDEYKRN